MSSLHEELIKLSNKTREDEATTVEIPIDTADAMAALILFQTKRIEELEAAATGTSSPASISVETPVNAEQAEAVFVNMLKWMRQNAPALLTDDMLTPAPVKPLPTREQYFYPIIMPLDKDGNGPAAYSDIEEIKYEVWDQTCTEHGRFEYMADAIDHANDMNYQLKVAERELLLRGK